MQSVVMTVSLSSSLVEDGGGTGAVRSDDCVAVFVPCRGWRRDGCGP